MCLKLLRSQAGQSDPMLTHSVPDISLPDLKHVIGLAGQKFMIIIQFQKLDALYPRRFSIGHVPSVFLVFIFIDVSEIIEKSIIFVDIVNPARIYEYYARRKTTRR
jgi:hypothetical protein